MPDSKPQPDSPQFGSQQNGSQQAEPEAGLTRRHFVQASAAFAALPLISSMSNAQESEEAAPTPTAALDKIEIGLVGCGGRGSGAARQALAADPGVVLTAMADVFPERIESSLLERPLTREDGRRRIRSLRDPLGVDQRRDEQPHHPRGQDQQPEGGPRDRRAEEPEQKSR